MAFSRKRSPESAAAILQKAFQVKHLEGKIERYSAIADWEHVVGPELAAVCIPEKIRRGNVLELRVVNTVWVQELSLRKEELLEKIRLGAATAMVEDIRFITGNPQDFRKQSKTPGQI